MIICVCNNVNVRAIKSTIDSGIDTLEGIRETTGAGACCGKCQFKVNRVLNQHISQPNDETISLQTANYS